VTWEEAADAVVAMAASRTTERTGAKRVRISRIRQQVGLPPENTPESPQKRDFLQFPYAAKGT
jgi:hypothetical protein